MWVQERAIFLSCKRLNQAYVLLGVCSTERPPGARGGGVRPPALEGNKDSSPVARAVRPGAWLRLQRAGKDNTLQFSAEPKM